MTDRDNMLMIRPAIVELRARVLGVFGGYKYCPLHPREYEDMVEIFWPKDIICLN